MKTLKTFAAAIGSDWRWWLVWSSLTVGLASLPFILGWLMTPPGQQFTGVLFQGNDTNTYLAKMLEGRQGSWVFHLAHTSESGGNGAITFEYYLVLGKLAGLLNLSNVLLFHLARVLNGFLLLFVSFGVIKLLFKEKRQQRLTFLLVCLASGLGWLTLIAGLDHNPPDFWVAEGYTFQSMAANPHFPLATALLILVIFGWLFGQEGRGRLYYLEAAFFALLLGFVHPFLLFTLGAVLGIFWLRVALAETQVETQARRHIPWTSFAAMVAVGVSGAPGAFLTWWGTQNDPLLRQWMSQNHTESLPLFQTLTGYGLLVPLTIAGIWWVERILPKQPAGEPKEATQLQRRWQLLTGWVVGVAVLMLLPVTFSRRFEEGLHLPLVALAAAGWFFLLRPAIARRWQPLTTVFLAIGLVASTLMVVAALIFQLYLPPTPYDPVNSPYLSSGEIGAIEWFQQHSQPGEVVLAGQVMGNVLPGRAPVQTFYGHIMETINPDEKQGLMNQFFDKATPMSQRYGIISSWGLKYLYFGWREAQLGTFDPSTGGWPLVYNQDGVKIYRLS